MANDELCLIRGGGDLGTGVAWRLTRSGFPVVVTDLDRPLAVRRRVALSTAIDEGHVDIEGMIGRSARSADEAVRLAFSGDVGVVASAGLPEVGAGVVVDARLSKRNIDTTITDARVVVALGPGFAAGVDCHAVVETLRGPRLGRVIWDGCAAADTGSPGVVGTKGMERVLRAPGDGSAVWSVAIGDVVAAGQPLGLVGGLPVSCPFDGKVRGLIREGVEVSLGAKIGDVDPRTDVAADEISDKALAVGGGVLEAVMVCLNQFR
ncbi:MAG: selenium-dependent molybdenum cofactor biosynthesis protein YqeB [Acidimicrobiales bacterium]